MFWQKTKFSLVILLFLTGLFSSCESIENRRVLAKAHTWNARIWDFEKQNLVDSIGNGDLVLRLGNDMTSNMLSQLNLYDKRFSHIGFCFIEDGEKVVYHSLGAESGGEQYLRRDIVGHFFNDEGNNAFGFARTHLSPEVQDKIHTLVRHWYTEKIPFDINFNIATDDSLYCSEMVAKAINKSLGAHKILATDTFGNRFYTIDDITKADIIDTIFYIKKTESE